MIYNREAAAGDAAMETAKKMVAAAVTAPKGCGHDNIEAMVLDGDEMMKLAEYCRQIGMETNTDFFVRDAKTIEMSRCVVLIAVSYTHLL